MACRCRTTKKMFDAQTNKIIKYIKKFNKQYRNFDGSDEFGGSPFMENYEEYETWSNAGGDPSVVVGGETFDMQPTLTWNRADFFGKQDGGFGASQKESAECNCCRVTNDPRCCHDCRSRDYGRGIPQGMGVEYRQI